MSKILEPFTGTKFNKATLYELSLFSNLAYKEEAIVKALLKDKGFTYVRYIESKRTMTQGYVAASDDNIVVFFRGTRDKRDILTDADIVKVEAPSSKKKEKSHRGFTEAWESVEGVTAFEVKKLLKEKDRRVWVTGHSLGAAIGGLASFDLQENHTGIEIAGAYFFGQPRFCNRRFSKTYNKKLKKVTFRIVNNNDIVTRVPFISMGFRHVGVMYYFDSKNKLRWGLAWWENILDRITGRLQDAFDGDLDGLADHSMPLYSKLCLANI
jgi:triacylglycerol lipase